MVETRSARSVAANSLQVRGQNPTDDLQEPSKEGGRVLRKRTQINYAEPSRKRTSFTSKRSKKQKKETLDDSSDDGAVEIDWSSGSEADELPMDFWEHQISKRVWIQLTFNGWTTFPITSLKRCLVEFGPDYFKDIRLEAELEGRSKRFVAALCDAILKLIHEAAELQREATERMMEADRWGRIVEELKAKRSREECYLLKWYFEGMKLPTVKEAKAKHAAAEELRRVAEDKKASLTLRPEFGAPAETRKILKKCLDELVKDANHSERRMVERRRLNGFFKDLQDGQPHAKKLARDMSAGSKVGKKWLPSWWGTAEDVGLLYSIYEYGLDFRLALEAAIRDPSFPFFNTLEALRVVGKIGFGIPRPRADRSNLTGPGISEVLEVMRGFRKPAKTQKKMKKMDLEDRPKIMNALITRTQALRDKLYAYYRERQNLEGTEKEAFVQ